MKIGCEGSRLTGRGSFVLICVQGFGEPAESDKQLTDSITPFYCSLVSDEIY